MSDRTEREKQLDWLYRLKSDLKIFIPKDFHLAEFEQSLDYAISSIKTDLKYDLLYEETREKIPVNLHITEIKKHQSDFSDLGQETRKGHWYRQTNDYVDYYECSECGMAMGLYDVKNYCPNCGSRNEVEE